MRASDPLALPERPPGAPEPIDPRPVRRAIVRVVALAFAGPLVLLGLVLLCDAVVPESGEDRIAGYLAGMTVGCVVLGLQVHAQLLLSGARRVGTAQLVGAVVAAGNTVLLVFVPLYAVLYFLVALVVAVPAGLVVLGCAAVALAGTRQDLGAVPGHAVVCAQVAGWVSTIVFVPITAGALAISLV